MVTRVVMIGPYSIYPKGTVPLRMVPIAEALHSKGYSVSIVLPPYDNLSESGKNYTMKGVDIYNIKIPKGFNIEKSILTKHLLIANSVTRKALELEPDLIHLFVPTGISGLSGMFLIIRKWLKLLKIAVVLDIDDWFGYGGFYNVFLEKKRGIRYRLVRLQQDWLLKHANAITTASKTLQSLVWSLGVSGNKVFYVPNGPHHFVTSNSAIDVKDIREKYELKGKPVVLLYTKFSEFSIKKVVNILKAAKSDIPDLCLLVVGKGELHEDEEFLQLAEKEGLKEAVAYTGWVKPEEIRTHIEVGDVAICPFEDTLLNRAKCPGKLVELMSLGKAIVAAKVGQIAEYIQDEKSGILVEPGDTKMFVQSLIRVLRNDDLRIKLGQGAKERIWDVFNWNKLMLGVEKAYKVAVRS